MIKPMSPQELVPKRSETLPPIPDLIIEVVNTLLCENMVIGSDSVEIKQDEILDRILLKNTQNNFPLGEILEREAIFENKWLDFEPIFEAHGWHVEYVKGPYYSTEPRYFLFTAKSSKS